MPVKKGYKQTEEHKKNVSKALMGHSVSLETRRKLSIFRTQDITKRFWDKVNKKDENKCWEWTGCKNQDGYGIFRLNHANHHAHRLSYILSGGILNLEKPLVLHHCDNPSCCNPKHLFAGSNLDNVKDMIEKGRDVRLSGENHPCTKLTNAEVLKIRYIYNTYRISQRIIASSFNINRSVVNSICLRKTWKNI